MGTLWCWGHGLVGDGTTTQRTAPVRSVRQPIATLGHRVIVGRGMRTSEPNTGHRYSTHRMVDGDVKN
jgi:hypothetical protein